MTAAMPIGPREAGRRLSSALPGRAAGRRRRDDRLVRQPRLDRGQRQRRPRLRPEPAGGLTMATRDRTRPARRSILPLYARAAAPLIPGASLLPFVPGGGGEIPDARAGARPASRADPDAVAAYAKVCGFALRDHLPPTYPHVLAFPLHMAVMADGRFPFGAVGLVHVENRIAQHRPIGIGEELTLRVRPTQAAAAPERPDLHARHRGPGRRRDRLGERQHLPAPRQGRPGRGRRRRGASAIVDADVPGERRVDASAATSAAATPPSPATATRSTCTR